MGDTSVVGSYKLNDALQSMHNAETRLAWSLQRCQPLALDSLDDEGEEKFVTLTTRFARMSGFFISSRLSDPENFPAGG